jgi:hypothetical protein
VNLSSPITPGDDRTGADADAQPQLWMFGPHGFQVALHGIAISMADWAWSERGSRKASDDHERIADSWRCQPSGTGSKAAC